MYKIKFVNREEKNIGHNMCNTVRGVYERTVDQNHESRRKMRKEKQDIVKPHIK